jgi:hypothetical protein
LERRGEERRGLILLIFKITQRRGEERRGERLLI